MVLPQLKIALVIGEEDFDKKTLYLIRLLLSHLHDPVCGGYLPIIEQHRALFCGGFEFLGKGHILDFFAEPDILKTADSTPLENLVMFRIVDPLKVILVALDERIEISGVHGSVSLFYIW